MQSAGGCRRGEVRRAGRLPGQEQPADATISAKARSRSCRTARVEPGFYPLKYCIANPRFEVPLRVRPSPMNTSNARSRAIAVFTILAAALSATLAGCTNKTNAVPAAQAAPGAVATASGQATGQAPSTAAQNAAPAP